MNNTEFDLRSDSLKIDVAASIAKSMARNKVSRKDLAKRIGISKSLVTKMLCGESNLTLETIAKAFSALGSRVDLVATPERMDEWLIKRQLSDYEDSHWENVKSWVSYAFIKESNLISTDKTEHNSVITTIPNGIRKSA